VKEAAEKVKEVAEKIRVRPAGGAGALRGRVCGGGRGGAGARGDLVGCRALAQHIMTEASAHQWPRPAAHPLTVARRWSRPSVSARSHSWLGLPRVLVDDAYIGLRYVDNLFHGNGLVFNPASASRVTNIGCCWPWPRWRACGTVAVTKGWGSSSPVSRCA